MTAAKIAERLKGCISLSHMAHLKVHPNIPFGIDSLSLTLSVYVIHKNVSMSPFFSSFFPLCITLSLHLSTSGPCRNR